VDRSRRFLATHGLDAVIVLLALAGALGISGRTDTLQPGGIQFAVEVAAVVVMILILLLRRRAPFVVPATTWLWSAALSFVDGRLIVGQAPVSISGMVAAVLLGNLREERQARIGLAVVVTSAACIVYNDPAHTVGNLIFIPVLFAVGWLIGFALRERQERTEVAEQRAARAERERENAARVAVAEERARIARELHDVVAHAVSVMVLQVGAVRHGMTDDHKEDREALQHVEQAGRTALAEMRRLLDAMRREDDQPELSPRPGLDRVRQLLDDVQAAGLDVRLDVEGDPVHLPAGLDLSAYRIIQEGLTNALKHANAKHACVKVAYGRDHLEVTVRDDGRSRTAPDAVGHGLIGIGERVKVFGGDMTVGPVDGGGFALRARLPLKAS
jgi:signal transduction histidine kinase